MFHTDIWQDMLGWLFSGGEEVPDGVAPEKQVPLTPTVGGRAPSLVPWWSEDLESARAKWEKVVVDDEGEDVEGMGVDFGEGGSDAETRDAGQRQASCLRGDPGPGPGSRLLGGEGERYEASGGLAGSRRDSRGAWYGRVEGKRIRR